MAGVSQTFGSVNNAGTIFTHGAGPGTTLTVAGNYVGANGNIVLNTVVGADNSPSDRLVISGGTATGTTMLTIQNTNGQGAQTTANGIAVVNAINGGTTAAGAFMLAPSELRAGAFDYRLFQGGINGSVPNDWFLRSSFLVSPSPLLSPPPTFPSPPLPPGLYPIIGPELATDSVVQPLARQLGLTMLGTLHQRIGDTLTQENADAGVGGLGPLRLDASLRPADRQPLPVLCGSARQWRHRRLPGRRRCVARQVWPGHRDAAGV